MFNFVKKYHCIKQIYKIVKQNNSNNNFEITNFFDVRKYCNQLLKAQSSKFNLDPKTLENLWIQNYFNYLEDSYKDELNQRFSELEKNYHFKVQQLIINSFNRLNYQYIRDEFVIKIRVSKEETRSRLVGLNARNKKTFERVCGVELIINENDENVCLSSANHIKREIAYRVLMKLIEIKNIEPNKIQNLYKQEQELFDQSLVTIGSDVVRKLSLHGIDPNLYPYIGRLRYRYSFGQNVLEHSIECAMLAEMVAKEINIDTSLAKLCAFFHDIGKSMDHEVGTDHVQIGVEIAQKFHLPPEVISAIASHHSSTYSSNIYDAIVKLIDKASASRPGARNNTKDNFFKRAKVYEDICMKYNEVKNAWVLQSGFVIKILLKPNVINSNFDIESLIQRLKFEFETNPQTRDYVVNVEIIREDFYHFKTNKIIA